MADRESNKSGIPERNKHISDPNPVAQTTSTIENRMNPSVTGDFEDPSGDSMFNNADPQTRELLKKASASTQNRGPRRPEAA
jgi:hypothetical protein